MNWKYRKIIIEIIQIVRKYALEKDDDAIIIDTTGLGIDEVIKNIDIIKDKNLFSIIYILLQIRPNRLGQYNK